MTKINRLRKFILILLITALVLSTCKLTVPAFALTEAPSVNVDCAVVIDCKTGTETYSKKEGLEIKPGSATKLMTALVAVKEGKWSDTNKSLIKSMLFEGSDSSARTLAKEIGGTEANYCKKMNALAKKIGCKNTKFTSVTGNTSNEEHKSTASDMSKIMTAFFENSKLGDLATVKGKEGKISYDTISASSENKIISNVVVSKKGDTQLVAFASGGVDKKRNEKDSKALLKYGHENYRTYRALSSGKSVGRIKIKGGQKSYTKVYAKKDLYVTLPVEGEESLVKLNVELKENLKAPVKKNTVVGKAQAIEAGVVTSSVDVVVKEDLAVGGPWSKLGISDNMMIVAAFALCLILLIFVAIRIKIRRKKKKIAECKRRQREKEAMRIAMERAEKEKRDWPY